MADLDDLHVIIPAGGSGTRLWPLSRRDRPKFLLDLTGSGRTLLQQTWDRLTALVPPERVHVVTGAPHADAVREQLPELQHLIAEPSPRDSMPAIGLAAAIIARRDPDAVVASFAADHVISGAGRFERAVRQAVSTARAGYVTTIGIAPRYPSTAFGYIESGDRLDLSDAPDARRVARFVEKPDAATAREYIRASVFNWNAGMFVTRADVLLDHLATLQPTLHRGISTIAAAWDGPDAASVLEARWPELTKIAIDHAVAEPVSLAGGIATVPGRFTWDDVGDFAALHELGGLPCGDVQWIGASGLAHATDGTPIAVVGLDDVVVVRTADATLVTSLEHAQRVKEVPAALREAGRDDLT